MANLGDYYRNVVLDAIFGSGTPATIYCALFTVTPDHTGGGTEVSGGSYARAAITNDTAHFPAASGGSQANGEVITYPAATGDWGTVVAFAYFDAPTSGNLIGFGAIGTPADVPSGSVAQFAIGALVVNAA